MKLDEMTSTKEFEKGKQVGIRIGREAEKNNVVGIINDNFKKWQNEEIEDVIGMIFIIKQQIMGGKNDNIKNKTR